MRKLNTELNLRDLHSLVTDYTEYKCKPWKIEKMHLWNDLVFDKLEPSFKLY